MVGLYTSSLVEFTLHYSVMQRKESYPGQKFGERYLEQNLVFATIFESID